VLETLKNNLNCKEVTNYDELGQPIRVKILTWDNASIILTDFIELFGSDFISVDDLLRISPTECWKDIIKRWKQEGILN